MKVDNWIEREIDILKDKGLLRSLTEYPATGGKFCADGREYLNFSSNDYLNFINNPDVKEAAIQATREWGCGAGASRLMSGHLGLHSEVEERIAYVCNTDTSLIFGSGFLANYGLISSFCRPGDIIFADKLNHASLIDGMRASGAKWFRYQHKNTEHLKKLLKEKNGNGKRIIITDAIFSMDGDIAPLKEISDLALENDAWLIIDEAHAFGLRGDKGGGVYSELGLIPNEKTLIVGTFSKALASYGGFVSCSDKIKTYLINTARSFIYSTGLPPSSLGAALCSLDKYGESPDLGIRLMEKVEYFSAILKKHGFSIPFSESQIIPVLIGDNKSALKLSENARKHGLLVTAIRPPTVPHGTSRIRVSITLAHTREDLDRGAHILCKCGRDLGIIQ